MGHAQTNPFENEDDDEYEWLSPYGALTAFAIVSASSNRSPRLRRG